jgi:hypothetical protein
MRAREFLIEAKVGRDLQHTEDYLIVDGAEGGIDALQDLKAMAGHAGDSSIKWDGFSAIYWGNDSAGNFYLIPKAQWEKKLVLDKAGLTKEIQSTGRQKPNQSEQEFLAVRQGMADKYLKLWDIFEAASQGTQGFFTGDVMFADRQTPGKDGNYVFTPNKVTYTVAPKGLYGKMPTADVFITVHGKAKELGSSALMPANPDEVKKLNSTPNLIALDKQTPMSGIQGIDVKSIDAVIGHITSNAGQIDSVANFTAPKFTSLKQIMYTYAVQLSKHNDALDFDTWLESSKVSEPQRVILRQLAVKPEWKTFWNSFLEIKKLKNSVFSQLTKQHGDAMWNQLGITASTNGQPGGEGYVTPAGKIVNPAFRSAPPNPRFTGEI